MISLAFLLFAVLTCIRPTISSPVSSVSETHMDNISSRGSDVLLAPAPRFVLYTDRYVPTQNGPPPVNDIEGFNVVILSFLLSSGPADQALAWTQLSPAERSQIKSQYAKKGMRLMVSAFGSTDLPTTARLDPTATANKMAEYVKEYGLDGIDVDYEDFYAMSKGDGEAETWLVKFTTQLRAHLPQGQYILTHAPVAPWFSPKAWGGGAYLTVDKKVGSMIDWYNIQFYNQGIPEYITCPSLLTESSTTWPKTSIFEISTSGVPLNKLVIGKPVIIVADASNGWMDPVSLATCVGQAKQDDWNAGVMFWEFPEATSPWIKVVRSESWPT